MTVESPLFTCIDHIGIATNSLTQSLQLYEHTFGLQITLREVIEDQGTEVVLLRCGDTAVELLAPLGPEGPVAAFLSERGPGMHHIAYRVQDIQRALEQCCRAGLQLVDQVPRRGAGGHQVAFLHPRDTGRVLIELIQT